MKLTISWTMILLILTVFALITRYMPKAQKSSSDKWNQFECGFMTMNTQHIPFSFQFFLVALLFLIFDVEISMIIAYPMEMQSTKKLITMFMFLISLAFGLVYEWQKQNWLIKMGEQ